MPQLCISHSARQCLMHNGAVQNAQMDEPHERLKYARRVLAGIETATEAARELHPDAIPTYLAHENGTRSFTKKDAERYARFFKVRVEWLIFNKGAPRSANTLDDRVSALSPEDQRLILEQMEFLEARQSLKRHTA